MSRTKASAELEFTIVELYDPLGSWRIDRSGRLTPIPISRHRRRDTAARAWRRQCRKLRGQQTLGFVEAGQLIKTARREYGIGPAIESPVMPRQ